MEKKENSSESRLYTINLRREWIKTRRVARSKRSISAIKKYVGRHMHSDSIYISPKISEIIWKSGAKKPPGKIKVKVTAEDGKVRVMLPEELTAAEERKNILSKKEAAKAEKKTEAAEEKAREAMKEEAAEEGKPAEESAAKMEESAKEKQPEEKEAVKKETAAKAPKKAAKKPTKEKAETKKE